MLLLSHALEIVKGVVCRVAVDVMYEIASLKFNAMSGFPNQPMFGDVPSAVG